MSSTTQPTSAKPEPIFILRDGIAVRRLHEDDISDSTKHLNDPEVRTYMRNRIPFPYTEANAEWWINHCSDQTHWVPSGPFDPNSEGNAAAQLLPLNYAIVKDNQHVGGIGLELKNDIYCRTAELGYWLARPYWGQGIMGLVAQAFVQWAFDTFGVIHRVEAEVFAGNGASSAVLKKAGLKFEGRHEGAIWKNGQVLAADFWGIVRSEKDDGQ